MNYNKDISMPSRLKRILSVWYRHVRVYRINIYSNSITPLLEALIFLAGLGIGFGAYIKSFGSIDYLLFLGSGMVGVTAMYAAAFECSFGTFIRLDYEKIYDGILGASISIEDMLIGEILFVGTKGFVFSLATLIVTWLVGIITSPLSIFAAFIGIIVGIMFGVLSMAITSVVKNINHFNFYFTGVLSPMFFVSGTTFPVENLPSIFIYIAKIMPLYHATVLIRAFCVPGMINVSLLYNLLYCIIFIVIIGYFAINGMKRRMLE